MKLGDYWRNAAALLSGALLALAFPPFNLSGLAWVALIPLLIALLRFTNDGKAGIGPLFRLGVLCGSTFWLISLGWLLKLVDTSPAPMVLIITGWLLLSGCCALYMGAFTITAGWLVGRIGTRKLWQSCLLTALIPLVWTGWEVARSYWITGFPWNLLGISQYRNLALIQCAEWVGVPGVSALVMLANTGLAFTILRYLPPREKGYRPHVELFMVLMMGALCFRSGMFMVRRQALMEGGAEVTVTAIQPAIPQVKKWSQDEVDNVHATLRRLTLEAIHAEEGKPDLVIWPETATPYCVTEEGESRDLVMQMSREGVPLLVGSMDMQTSAGGTQFFNGSFLLNTNGGVSRTYYKQHLVPFGEYVPLSGWIPWLANLAPMGWNCEPGRQATVFTVGDPSWSFSSLICFEDIMSGLSRSFVKAGARLLVNQTNDAWFDGSAGPEQHLSHCVFRCVENRVPAVRVANSGISCLILPTGAVLEATRNDRQNLPRPAIPRWQMIVQGEDFKPTFYTVFGDWTFGIPCAALAAGLFLWILVQTRRTGCCTVAFKEALKQDSADSIVPR